VNRPTNIRAQEDLVRQAEAVVAFDRDTLEFSYVYAPVDGTVTAVTGTVGEFMNGGVAQVPTSPLAPGSQAQIPDVGGPAAADQAASDGGQGLFPLEALRATAPGGGASSSSATSIPIRSWFRSTRPTYRRSSRARRRS
jgi:HlyD family secretion protein